MKENKHRFTAVEREAIYKVMAERRDMRHFNGLPLDETLLQRLIAVANMAPSVGLMQPWRFIRITKPDLRLAIHKVVAEETQTTAEALGTRKEEFLKLKVEGILQCSELLVAALPDKRESHIFGRRTMPEMDLASLACAIQNMWLAARAEGIGLGWVSLFEPERIKTLMKMPSGSHPVAILCIGHVDEFYPKPMLEMKNWIQGKGDELLMFENQWQDLENH